MIVTQQAIENHRRILTEMDSKFGGYVGIDAYVAFQLALLARIAELEAMVRELVEATEAEYHVVAGDQYHMLCPGSAIKVNTTCSWIVMATGERSSHRNKDRVQILNAARAEALALLNQEERKP